MASQKADFFVFGATSELVQALVRLERPWFEKTVGRFILVTRSEASLEAYDGFDTMVMRADAGDIAGFRQALDGIVASTLRPDRPVHILPTYGIFNTFRGLDPLRFRFSDTGYQVNLNARLQIIDAFRHAVPKARFHLFGSLLGSFPYLGDYSQAMWAVNELPRHPEYAGLDLRVYHLGGLKTRFWDHAAGPANNPFVHAALPTRWLVERMEQPNPGIFTCYPSALSRVAVFLARRGLRLQ